MTTSNVPTLTSSELIKALTGLTQAAIDQTFRDQWSKPNAHLRGSIPSEYAAALIERASLEVIDDVVVTSYKGGIFGKYISTDLLDALAISADPAKRATLLRSPICPWNEQIRNEVLASSPEYIAKILGVEGTLPEEFLDVLAADQRTEVVLSVVHSTHELSDTAQQSIAENSDDIRIAFVQARSDIALRPLAMLMRDTNPAISGPARANQNASEALVLVSTAIAER